MTLKLYSILVTALVAFLLSVLVLWETTVMYLEDVLAYSFFITFFVTGVATWIIDGSEH